ncbi:MAG: beta-propeller fold lactonase family protein [Acidobacteria bacterium]|nr:beta-propeller fold lactonase family protein [Acidobacteriota bacterium]
MTCQVTKRCFYWVAAVLLLAATSNGLFGQMLYVGNFADATISAYVIDQESGILTEILPRVATPGRPTSVTVHPSGKFAYVTNGGDPAIGGPNLAAFSIDANTGALTLLGSAPVTPGSSPQSAVVDPSGKFVFVAHQGANNVSVFSIDTLTGAVSPIQGSPFATPQGPSSLVVHPNGKVVYVSAGGAGQIAAFNIGANGALTPVAGSPFAARNNLFWMAMDAAGKFLFAVQRQQNGVLVYSVNDTTGALTLVMGSPFPVSGAVAGVAVDPAGKFLYASNVGGTVHGYRIGATGALTPIPPGFYPAPFGAFAVILDPSGKFLYVPAQQSNVVGGYAIDADSGALTPLPGAPFPAGVQPQRGATVLLTPPVIPPISADSALSLFSHALPGMPNAAIAQGSRLAISGKNIGPAAGVTSDFPLKTELRGASIQIQSGDVTTAALMIYASNGFVTGVVPSTTPLGDATVTVTYKGRMTAPLPITIVKTSVGIRTLNGRGNGPAKAWTVPPDTVLRPDPSILQTPNTLNQSAKPGQLVVVHATGLGPVTFDETQDLSQELGVPADVIVGNKLATVMYELGATWGTDYIVFKLPADAPEGCYVPIAIRAGGVTSNAASISVSATGGSCSDATGLAASDIDAAQKSGQIRMGTILLNHIDFAQFGADDEAAGIFARYDFNALLEGFSPGNNGAGIRPAFGTPPLGTCTVSPGTPTITSRLFDLPSDQTPFQFLNAGPALNLSGPKGTVQLPAPSYYVHQHDSVITPGDYTVDNGTGTQAVGPFKAVLNLPPMVTWTNKDDLAFPDRTQDLTVTWSGGIPDKEFALIVGLAVSNQVTAGFLCAEKVSAGRFTVPAWVLSSLPASDAFTDGDQILPGGLLGVGTAPLTSVGRFTGPGLDFGVFTYEQATVNLVYYR